MAFFNYSTMQMTAKIVYYGPGLCGKTTNLQFIYDHTTQESRGEMVSLETQTDRTLFFDLLPMEVGTVAGFKARIQLYTVPGQVFYNTTRKLVLKGVDGVVFVADSQQPMLAANKEAMENLAENLGSLGLSAGHDPDGLAVQQARPARDRQRRGAARAAAPRQLAGLRGLGDHRPGRGRDAARHLQADAAVAAQAARVVGRRRRPRVPRARGAGGTPAAGASRAASATPAASAAPPATSAPPAAPPARAAAVPTPAATPPPAASPEAPPAAAAEPEPPVPAPSIGRREPQSVRRDVRLELESRPDALPTERIRLGLRLEDGGNRLLGELDDLVIDVDSAGHARLASCCD